MIIHSKTFAVSRFYILEYQHDSHITFESSEWLPTNIIYKTSNLSYLIFQLCIIIIFMTFRIKTSLISTKDTT